MKRHTTTYTIWPSQEQLPACKSCKFDLMASRNWPDVEFPLFNPSLGLIPQTLAGTNTALKHTVSRKVSDQRERAERYHISKSNIKDRHSKTYNLKLKKELLKKRVWDQVTGSGSLLWLLSLILEIDTRLAVGTAIHIYSEAFLSTFRNIGLMWWGLSSLFPLFVHLAFFFPRKSKSIIKQKFHTKKKKQNTWEKKNTLLSASYLEICPMSGIT